MGQYYLPVLEIKGEQKVYDNYADGDYMGAKLMEHSWWRNSFVLAVASKFWRTTGKLAWVGDYANEVLSEDSEIWELRMAGERDRELKYNGFRLEGKFFVNHTKGEFIGLDDYLAKAKEHNKIWVINPIPLLTAIGGQGGGDYRGKNSDKVGSWAWNDVEITDGDMYSDYKDVTDQVIFWEE